MSSVRIGSSWLILLLAAAPARADDDEEPNYETTVSAERPPSLAEPPPLAPADVQTLDRRELEASGAATVAEALQRLGGLELQDQQGNSLQPDVVVRGVPASPVTGLPQGLSVFVDGVRVNEATVEEVNFDLLPLDDVERIVIVRGPGTLAGRNTLAGAIYILTRRGSRRALEAELGTGSFGRREARLRAGGPSGPVDGYLSAGFLTEDGFRQAGAARSARLLAKVGVGGRRGDAVLSYQLQRDRIQQPGSLPVSLLALDRTANYTGGDFFAPTLQQGTLGAYASLAPSLFAVGQGFVRALDTEQFNASASAASTRLRSRIRGGGGTLALVHRLAARRFHHELRVGLDVARYAVDVSVVAQPDDIPAGCDVVREDCAGSTTGAVLADAQRAEGFFAHEAFQIGPAVLGARRTLSLSLGLRGDRVSHDVTDTTPDSPGEASGRARYSRLLPAAAVRLSLSPRIAVGGFYAEGFRAPAFLELTCAQEASPCIGLQAGVAPDTGFAVLRPVRARDYELDFDVATERGPARGFEAGLEAALFRMDLLDDIFSVSPNGRTDVFFQNLGRTRRQGLELRARARLGGVALRLAYTFVRATFEDDLLLGSPRTPGMPETVRAGAQLPLVPQSSARADLTWTAGEGVTLGLDALYVGPSYLRGDEENEQPQLGGYLVTGARARVDFGRFWWALRATNLTDRRYETFGTFATNARRGGAVEPFLTPAAPLAVFTQIGYRLGQ